MPTASDKDRDLITKWFGGIEDYPVLQFLESHGYTERRGMIYLPVPSHTISRDEWECIRFLAHEWDYSIK